MSRRSTKSDTLIASARQVLALDKLSGPWGKVYAYLAEHDIP